MNTQQRLAVATLVLSAVGCVIGVAVAAKTRKIIKSVDDSLKAQIKEIDDRIAAGLDGAQK